MSLVGQVTGWLLVIVGTLACLVSRFHSFFPFESNDEEVAFNAFRPYVFGLGLLAAIVGAIVLRASGVEFTLFDSV